MKYVKSELSRRFNRRSFLAGAAAATGLFFIPRSVFADSADDVVLRAAVTSDVHYNGSPDAPEVKRFEGTMKFMYEYSATQPYKNFDALLVGGDMSNNGKEDQIGLFCQSMDKCLKPETKRVLCMGNHDHWGGNRPLWERVFQTPANNRVEINGFQFITLSCEKGTCRNGDFQYAMPWLKEQLDAACAENTNKPVFLMQHYHISNTVYGSCNPDNWGTNDLCELLKNYPRVINFSGHSHYPINDPRSAWQGEYTAFGTGTLSYYEMSGGKYNKFPPGHRNAAPFYIMEIHADNSVVLKVYDMITNSFYDCVYVVADPGNAEKYVYTDARYQTSQAPFWSEGAAADVTDATDFGATLTFPQAKWNGQENIVMSYRADVYKKIDANWILQSQQYDWSKYFYNDMPDTMTFEVKGLDESSEYKATITALNCFEKESQQTLEATFATLADPNECVDKTAAKPNANILDVHFTADGPVNTAVNKLPQQKPVEVFGSPQFVEDAALGAVAAVFDGKKDYCRIRFSGADYSRMVNQLTMSVKFKIDKFEARGMDVFGNTQNAGCCFEINGKTKQLEFWAHVGGKYQIVAAPIKEGEYVTAIGVFNGRTLVLYVNGAEAVKLECPGQIRHPGSPACQAFCIGSDISNKGEGEFFFPGSIVYARIYSWALSAEQIKGISN